MANRSILPGDNALSINQRDADSVFNGETFAIPPRPTHGPRVVTWSYEPGVTKPTSITIRLFAGLKVDSSGDLLDPIAVGTDYTTFGTAFAESVDIGKFLFARIQIAVLTGSGPADPIDGRISY